MCEMKSPHLADLNLGRVLANFSRDLPRFADFSRDFATKTQQFFDKIKVAEKTRKK